MAAHPAMASITVVNAYLEEINAQGGAIYIKESANSELERLKMF